MRSAQGEGDSQTWNRRYREYTEKIKTGSRSRSPKCYATMLELKGDKELFGERKMLDTARSLLVKGLSIAKAHPEEDHGRAQDDLRQLSENTLDDYRRAGEEPGPFSFSISLHF